MTDKYQIKQQFKKYYIPYGFPENNMPKHKIENVFFKTLSPYSCRI